jgi:ParB family chromosome partitioning protein
MTKGGSNKAFGASILARATEAAKAREADGADTPLNPATSILQHRENTLASMTSGKTLPDGNMLVDPARVRIWEHHNRDQEWLSEETCSDLIESIKAEGRQRIPAIVRRVKNDADFDFELIAGRRRHWSVSWLRDHHYENIEFLITIQNLTDQEAFRVADLENRNRKDISDIERARDYQFALGQFYEGKQVLMAERLGVTRSWLSRYLVLADIPREILAAFHSIYEIGVSHAAQLASLLRKEDSRLLMEREAERIAATQAASRDAGKPLLNPSEVVRRLIASTVSKAATEEASERRETVTFNAASGRPMMTVLGGRGGAITVKVVPNSGASRKELMSAFSKALDDF